MSLSVKEYNKFHMPWRVLRSIIPIMINEDISLKDKRNLESWVSSALVPSKQGVSTKTIRGRGGMRKFSISSAIAITTLWELVRFGFKPFMCTNIIDQMILLGERAVEEDNLAKIEPLFIYYDHSELRPGRQMFISASKEDIAYWILNPKKEGVLKSKISVKVDAGFDFSSVPVFMILDAPQILEWIISCYLHQKHYDFDTYRAYGRIKLTNKEIAALEKMTIEEIDAMYKEKNKEIDARFKEKNDLLK